MGSHDDAPARPVMSPERSRELKQFLRAMRARLDPRDVGLPAVERRRRAPGLRIEEAAALAGVGLTWYTALEAGKEIRVSAKLLHRVADALRLSADERGHLFALAQPPEPPARAAESAAGAIVQAIIDGFTTGPAFVCDRFWNIEAWNELTDRVYGHARSQEKNLLVRMMLDPAFRSLHTEWERIARQMVGITHTAFGRTPDDAAGIALVQRLLAESNEFREWWTDFRLQEYVPTTAILDHPSLGRLELRYTSFVETAAAAGEPDRMLILQPPIDERTRRVFASASAPTHQNGNAE